MKKTKITSFILSLALILSSLFCLSSAISVEAAAESTGVKPKIISKNISYDGDFSLLLAVDAETVSGGSVKIEVFDESQTKLNEYSASKTQTINFGNVTKEVYVVKTGGIAAKAMAKQYYFRATDTLGNIGDLERYSVAEYCYERTYFCECTESQLEFYKNILNVGASTQKVLVNEKDNDPSNDETLVTDYRLVSVIGGTLSDGYTQGIYKLGEEVTVTPDPGVLVWKVADLETKAITTETANTFTVNSHLDITAAEKGQGEFFNNSSYKSYFLTYDDKADFSAINATPVYRAGGGYPSGGNSATLTAHSADLITLNNGIDKVLQLRVMEAQDSGNGSAPAIHFSLFDNDTTKTTYIFESDVRFSSVGEGANIENGRNAFGFVLGNKYASSPSPDSNAAVTSPLMSDVYGSDIGKTFGSPVKMVVEGGAVTDYTLHGKSLGLDEWNNLKITFHTADKAYKVYLNGDLIYSTIYSNIDGVTGMTVAVNKAVGGLMGVQFDNTYCGTYDYMAYRTAIDNAEREAEWNQVYLDAGADENAEATVAALKTYYRMFDREVLDWVAGLYDSTTGAFYYANSGRDDTTGKYGPDIESTSQALALLEGTGLLKSIGGVKNLPDDMKIKLGSWVKGLQDPNGYFYHPQWTHELIDSKLSRKGRDLNQALNILNITGFNPTYTVNGIEGDYTLVDGTKVDSAGNPITSEVQLTGRLMYSSPVVAASKVIATASSVTASHLQDEASFRAWLDTLDIRNNSYSAGNTLATQASQIKARDAELKAEGADYSLTAILEQFLADNQNTQTGTWDHAGKGPLEGNNGVLKIAAAYNELGIEFPNADLAIQNAINIIESDGTDAGYETTHVCDTYNTWFTIDLIFQNLRKFVKDPAATEAEIESIRADLLAKAPKLIENTILKLTAHQKADGSFSYYKDKTSSESQGVPVAVGNQNEGDMNSTYICIDGTTSHMLKVLGLSEPEVFKTADYYYFISILNNN